MLAMSVFFALRDAAAACRGRSRPKLRAPATAEALLDAVGLPRHRRGSPASRKGALHEGFGHAARPAAAGMGPIVRVVVATVRGSAPREPGACILVLADGERGTIGGGHLELFATRAAATPEIGVRPAGKSRVRAAPPPRNCAKFGLGPALGRVLWRPHAFLLEPISGRQEPWQAPPGAVEQREPAVLVTAIGDAGAEKIVVSADDVTGALSDPRRHAEAVEAARGAAVGWGWRRAAGERRRGAAAVRARPVEGIPRRSARRRPCRPGAGTRA